MKYVDQFNPDAAVLTLISIVLTVLAIILGLGAFFGVYLIRDVAIFAAEEVAKERIDSKVKEVMSVSYNKGRDDSALKAIEGLKDRSQSIHADASFDKNSKTEEKEE